MHTPAEHPRSQRPAVALLRSVTRVALTAVCLLQAWAIVFVLQIGPEIGAIDARAGRGVHSGDVLAVPLVAAALVLCVHGRAEADRRRLRVARTSL